MSSKLSKEDQFLASRTGESIVIRGLVALRVSFLKSLGYISLAILTCIGLAVAFMLMHGRSSQLMLFSRISCRFVGSFRL